MMRLLFSLLICSSNLYADTSKRSPSEMDQAEFLSVSNKHLAKVKSEKALKKKLKVVRDLVDEIKSTRSKLSERLSIIDKANEDGKHDAEREKLERREEEAIFWELSFEQVTKSVLDSNFSKKQSFRKKTCSELPHKVRFDELVHQPEDSELGPYRAKALELLNELCK